MAQPAYCAGHHFAVLAGRVSIAQNMRRRVCSVILQGLGQIMSQYEPIQKTSRRSVTTRTEERQCEQESSNLSQLNFGQPCSLVALQMTGALTQRAPLEPWCYLVSLVGHYGCMFQVKTPAFSQEACALVRRSDRSVVA